MDKPKLPDHLQPIAESAQNLRSWVDPAIADKMHAYLQRKYSDRLMMEVIASCIAGFSTQLVQTCNSDEEAMQVSLIWAGFLSLTIVDNWYAWKALQANMQEAPDGVQ